jgi:16S rRNA (guanine1516-N2)-methyltransferase
MEPAENKNLNPQVVHFLKDGSSLLYESLAPVFNNSGQYILKVTEDMTLQDSSLNHYFFNESSGILYLPKGQNINLLRNIAARFNKLNTKGLGDVFCRAIGKDISKPVYDLTFGWGEDALFLAQQGFRVFGVERNPLLFVCFQFLRQKNVLPSVQSVSLKCLNSLEFLNQSSTKIDGVTYLDPMFPSKKGSALPRKEMQILQSIQEIYFHNTDDANHLDSQLLNLALQKFSRVVVKRPIKAQPLLSMKSPQGSIHGKLIRYDIY